MGGRVGRRAGNGYDAARRSSSGSAVSSAGGTGTGGAVSAAGGSAAAVGAGALSWPLVSTSTGATSSTGASSGLNSSSSRLRACSPQRRSSASSLERAIDAARRNTEMGVVQNHAPERPFRRAAILNLAIDD